VKDNFYFKRELLVLMLAHSNYYCTKEKNSSKSFGYCCEMSNGSSDNAWDDRRRRVVSGAGRHRRGDDGRSSGNQVG
jgi:hypothetical protein